MSAKFDLDLQFGQEWEHAMSRIINGDSKIEVKSDRMVQNTGNIAVEYEYNGRPSGINNTDAHYFVYFLPYFKTAVIFETARLREICEKCEKIKGGDERKSSLYLVPLNKVFEVNNYVLQN